MLVMSKKEASVARAAAIANGEIFYMGRPCRRGHGGKKYVCDYSCPECTALYQSRPEEKVRRAEHDRSRLYDLTPLEYNCMFAGQQFRCALCGTDEPGCRNWNTDHCHNTDVARGILCHTCNIGLGQLGDTPEALYRAYLYTIGKFTWTQTQRTNDYPTPTTSVTAGQAKVLPFIAQAAKPPIDSSVETQSQNSNAPSRKSA